MSKYFVEGESITKVADEVRTLSGTNDTMSLETMVTQVNNAVSQINNQSDLLSQIKTALQSKSINPKNYELITISNSCSNVLEACTAFEEFISTDNSVVIFINEDFTSKPDENTVNNTALVFVWFSNIFEYGDNSTQLGLWLRWRDSSYSNGILINSLFDFIISAGTVFRKVIVK